METTVFAPAPAGARLLACACAAVGIVLAAAAPAEAQSADSDIWTRSTLLGDPGGWRGELGADGVSLGVQDTETLLGNVAGGVKQGATMQGLTTATLQIDTGKAFGVAGGTLNASALQIHGRSLSPFYLDDLQTANGTEADDATRLWELWYDQSFARGAADLKLGQQSIDQEFIVSTYSAVFVNTMAGWPLVPSADLYAGGPAYPLSSLGARLRAKPTADATVLFGVFDDNPPGGPFADDPQSSDAGGTRFNTTTGALVIAEFQYAVNRPAVGDMVYSGDQPGLPGTYKIGFWFDTGRFPDQAYDTEGNSLASAASNGMPAGHLHNDGVYAVMDQTVWRPAPGSARSLNLFARVMGAPGDRNLVSFAFNGGVVLTAPLPGRDSDSAGIDVGVGKVSSGAAAYDRALGFATGTAYPVRGVETLIEITYQFQLAPWWLIQPDVQYVVNPGGGVPDHADPTRRLRNELVVGVRTAVTF